MSGASNAARRAGQPLISLTIPTFNRAPFLAELLQSLLPQFVSLSPGTIELLISDNCSVDNTAEVVAGFQQRGLACRYVRNDANIGADGNFLQCLEQARGQYVWVMGDDDLLLPNALADLLSLLSQGDFDLVYLSSFSFTANDDTAQRILAGTLPAATVDDKLGRIAEEVTEGDYFLEKINALIGLISVMLVNKNRLMATPHPPIETLHNSNLMQVGWLFPLVHRRMSVLYVWRRMVGYRSYNSGGWGICEVFGVRLERIARQYFSAEPELATALMNGVLRYWLCDAVVEMRRGRHAEMNAENFASDIRHIFNRNWRYWVFVWPVAELPMPLVEVLHGGLRLLNKLTRAVQGVFRHAFRHGRYIVPRTSQGTSNVTPAG